MEVRISVLDVVTFHFIIYLFCSELKVTPGTLFWCQVVRELLNAGVDLTRVETHSGLTALQLAEEGLNDPDYSNSQFRKIVKMIKTVEAGRTDSLSKCPKLRARACALCQAPKCKFSCVCSPNINYCSKQCQRKHWKSHKKAHKAHIKLHTSLPRE